MADLKLALRKLLKTPFVTTVAILSLALGIGANAAIYSLLDQMLLAALPVTEPERLVNLVAPGPKHGSNSSNQAGPTEAVLSYPMFRDLERAQTTLSGLAAHRLFGVNLALGDETVSGEGLQVSGSYFPLLGVRPVLGRLLTPSDDETIGGHPVVVLGYGFWERQFALDPGVLNAKMLVNGVPMTVVGVAGRGFAGTTLGARPDVFVPLTMRGVVNPWFDAFDNRRNYWAYVFGRLEPGVTVEQATAELNRIYSGIINEVEAPLQTGMSEQTMERFRAKQLVLEAGRRGQSSVHEEARIPLLLLFGVTALVLLIACANIANLLLARGAARAQEMAIRGSLGAKRSQLLKQLVTESLVLAVAGGLASLLVARWTLGVVAAMLPPDAAASLALEVRPAAILFAGLVAIGTGLLFGLYPAFHSTRASLATTLRSSTGQAGGARAAARFRASLVTAQIAFSMALLASAGLFVQSLLNVTRVDLGLRADRLAMFEISPELNGYDHDRSLGFYEQVEDELAAMPGVTSVSAGLVSLLAGYNWNNNVSVQGFESGPDTDANSAFNAVGPDYFRTMGIPLIAGREFTRADVQDGAPVAIVNEAFARKFGLEPNEVVGARMAVGRSDDGELDIEIVGLMRDAKYSDVKDDVPPLYVIPYRQGFYVGAMTFYLRTAADPGPILRSIPGVIKRLDANLPVTELKTMRDQARENIFLERMISRLCAAFAILATLLAAVGLYGVLAYSVAQRTREIGVRMALGAGVRRVRTMILRQVGWMLLIGGLIGGAAALALGRAAASLLFGLEGNDPFVLTTAALVLALVAFGAGYLPALRASRVDPMQALRYE